MKFDELYESLMAEVTTTLQPSRLSRSGAFGSDLTVHKPKQIVDGDLPEDPRAAVDAAEKERRSKQGPRERSAQSWFDAADKHNTNVIKAKLAKNKKLYNWIQAALEPMPDSPFQKAQTQKILNRHVPMLKENSALQEGSMSSDK